MIQWRIIVVFFFLIHSYLVSSTLTLWKEAVNGDLQLVKKKKKKNAPGHMFLSSSIYWHLMFSLKLKTLHILVFHPVTLYASQLCDRSVWGSKLVNLLKSNNQSNTNNKQKKYMKNFYWLEDKPLLDFHITKIVVQFAVVNHLRAAKMGSRKLKQTS